MTQTNRPVNKAFFKRNGTKIKTQHYERIIQQARHIEKKVKRIPALHRLWKDVLLCLELVRDYHLGQYKDVAPWAIAAVAFGLLYLVNPVELIPDVIPVVGYLDDVAIMALILKLVKIELKRYANWRKARADYENTVARLFSRE